MVIRRAEPADAEAIAAVHVRSWQAAYPGLMPQAYLDGLTPAMRLPVWERLLGESSPPRTEVLVAEADGSVAGFAALGPDRDDDVDPASVAEISAIYLMPEVWGAGVGGRLMAAALDSSPPPGMSRPPSGSSTGTLARGGSTSVAAGAPTAPYSGTSRTASR
ncbi:GNAT family N-acetyltransferase [Microbispora sp. NBRC 16548]|uniref:GNAT family N-acetyltransferase n=1 Tax=Microbispora sp. NBRC 16548 TaxID=3030994 RepID=UPI002556A98C|nr:GNAT family N-acetyltransferase [Microbispora sp. NBRC 16548]